MSAARSFLLLQGPMGSFFKKLGAELRRHGHRTLRVNFNGGDRLHYSSRYTVDYLGTLEQWPQTLLEIVRQHHITDLVVYGDCRPLHQIAIDTLKPLGIAVHVFEEGYFRPNWVTLERNGVNGYSSLPRDAEFYRDQLAQHGGQETPSVRHVGTTFARLARHTISYYVASALMLPLYRQYRTHRAQTYQKEGLAWLVQLSRNWLRRRFVRGDEAAVVQNPQPYFLVLLQLLGDSQITHHSPYRDMYEFLDDVLRDFTENAPPEARIVVKNHPLDNGLARYRTFLQHKAQSLGLRGRLEYIEGGHLPTLLMHARGVLTVNSTGGLSAIHHGIPTRLFGTAVYAIDGMVNTQPLATFWKAPQRPDKSLYAAFRHFVLRHTQVHGSFYTRLGIRLAVKGSAPRILDAPLSGQAAGGMQETGDTGDRSQRIA